MPDRQLDPYRVLDIPRDASRHQIARAHRRLAKAHHPDLHPGVEAAERMQDINHAWHILSSPTRRARYDAEQHLEASRSNRSHWAASRRTMHQQGPTAAQPWATWSSAAEPGAGSRAAGMRPPESAVRWQRRPQREPEERQFGDSGLAAALVGIGLAVLLITGLYLRSVALGL